MIKRNKGAEYSLLAILLVVLAAVVTGWALWLRWRKGVAATEPVTETQLQTETDTETRPQIETDTETHISAP